MVRGTRFWERLGRVTFQAAVAGAFVFMILPIALVLWLSFFRNEILSLPPEGYSLRWYSEMFAQRQFIGHAKTQNHFLIGCNLVRAVADRTEHDGSIPHQCATAQSHELHMDSRLFNGIVFFEQ